MRKAPFFCKKRPLEQKQRSAAFPFPAFPFTSISLPPLAMLLSTFASLARRASGQFLQKFPPFPLPHPAHPAPPPPPFSCRYIRSLSRGDGEGPSRLLVSVLRMREAMVPCFHRRLFSSGLRRTPGKRESGPGGGELSPPPPPPSRPSCLFGRVLFSPSAEW